MIASNSPRGLRAIALFKAVKVLMVFIAALMLCSMMASDVHAVAIWVVDLLHLHPDWRFTQVILEKAAGVTNANIWFIIGTGFGYTVIRGAEAYGLWRGLRWAEWFTLSSGGLYIPLELHSMSHGITWVNVGALLLSIAITGYVGWVLYHSRRRRRVEEGTG
ncbi:MAG: hypothetical protein JWO08_1035 [Verrucomicrobiaceae bacterium]|nr:hypothetical protein [Verrucomicrobiaceae bacterium]